MQVPASHALHVAFLPTNRRLILKKAVERVASQANPVPGQEVRCSALPAVRFSPAVDAPGVLWLPQRCMLLTHCWSRGETVPGHALPSASLVIMHLASPPKSDPLSNHASLVLSHPRPTAVPDRQAACQDPGAIQYSCPIFALSPSNSAAVPDRQAAGQDQGAGEEICGAQGRAAGGGAAAVTASTCFGWPQQPGWGTAATTASAFQSFSGTFDCDPALAL